MNRSQLPETALLLLLCGAAPEPQQTPDVAHVPSDPDSGLAVAFRAKLGLIDVSADSRPSERWSALAGRRLNELATLWGRGGLPESLAGLTWLDSDLQVHPLVPAETEPLATGSAWSVSRASSEPERPPPEQGLGRALASWRALFGPGARLDHEVFDVLASEREIVTRARLVATGPRGRDRVQHNVTWTCTWRPAAEGLELVALRSDSFEAIALAGHPGGLFADVSASVFADEPVFRRQLAPGLDSWRVRIDAALEPASLGHHGIALGDVDGDGLEDLYLCQPGGLPNRLFLHRPDGSMRDVAAEAGVDLLDYSSSVLLLDLDEDGDPDLLVSTATALVFYANDGTGRFEQVLALPRSLATSLAASDYDEDGDLDVYVCSYLSPYEKDGLPVPYHDADNGEANVLLRNDGDWSFTDATDQVGLGENNRRFSFAAAWEDYDNDGDQDLYVANDFGRNNLYRNEGGRFGDVAPALAAEDVSAGMGVTWGDADGDGWMDLYVTNMYTPAACRLTARPGFRPGSPDRTEVAYRDHAMGNSLLLNRQGRVFEDLAEASGTARGRWAWGALFLDLDNDGRLDLFSPNGFVTGESREDLDSFFWRQVVLQSPDAAGGSTEAYALGWRAVNRLVRQGYSWNGNERNAAFLNLGDAAFADVSSATGLDLPDDARAAARVDWDGDGDLDLIVTNRTGPMIRLLANQLGPSRWIALRLRGTSCNRSAVGARVVVETSSGARLIRSVRCGEGYLAQSSSSVHFGLGDGEVESVEVRWPGAGTEQFGRLEAGRSWLLEEGSGRAVPLARPEVAQVLAPGPVEISEPGESARTVLATPLPLARLVLETTGGRPAPILGITMEGPRGTGSPLLLVLWGTFSPAGPRALEALGAAADRFRAAGVQVLALSVDEGPARERARAQLGAIGWPFSVGFASAEALRILEVVLGTLHDSARSLPVPTCLLIDPEGQLIVTYLGRPDPAQVLGDLELVELSPEARRAAAVPFPGRWIAPPPGPIEDRVAAGLAARGLERAAAEYRLARVETRQLSAAAFEYEMGVARQTQGRLDEAIDHYRRALEVDPAHFLATRSLAMALHEKGEHALALEAYRGAVALAPSDALTRCNLGLVLLALGDVASAQRELAVLRTLDDDLARRLAQAIESLERGR